MLKDNATYLNFDTWTAIFVLSDASGAFSFCFHTFHNSHHSQFTQLNAELHYTYAQYLLQPRFLKGYNFYVEILEND